MEADLSTLESVSGPLSALRAGLLSLAEAIGHDHDPDGLTAARYCRETVLPAMAAVREAADELEALVADDLRSLPTYQEMLYIR